MKVKTIFFILALFLFGYAHSQTDSRIVKNQRGLLVISAYNFQYDNSGGHMKPVGFHDYFFPCNFFDNKLLSDSNLAITFKNGLRVEGFKQRSDLKLKAKRFEGIDPSNCYINKQFYLIPVILSYKMNEDHWPFSCERNYLDFSITNGASIKFNYLHKEIDVLAVSEVK